MNQRINLCWEDLHSLFTVVMCIDESMRLIYASETLSRCLPEAANKSGLLEVFDILRPTSLATFSDGLNSLGKLCLLTAKNGSFAIRGQLLRTQYQEQDVLCFCGSPWLSWVNTNCPASPLSLKDFSAQDAQLDHLFFTTTEKKMVDDLEQLNLDLKAAKRQLEESQEMQKQFFAHMSHEIRTPLNGVVSALSLLDHQQTSTEQSKLIRLAQSSSKNLMQVVNYVMSVSKLELSPGQGQTVFSWPDLIRSTIDILAATAAEKSLQIELDLSPSLPQACHGHPARLRQTLLNLTINAIKFTDSGKITIRALPLHQTQDHCILRLEVLDTGIGIPKEHLPHIFEPFWTSRPNSITTQEEGTGLGLDIVRRNVRSLGGEIMVNSRPGQGSKFWFELPTSLPTKFEAGSEITATQQETDTRELTGRVMLVDDNEANLLLGNMILESLGLEVISVDGGAAAVEAARQQKFDLILMDIHMPDIDGVEATRQIRTFASDDLLPIIAMTAYTDAQEKAACLDAGMNDLLTKPIIREQLHKTLATWLAKEEKLYSKETAQGMKYESGILDHELVSQPVIDDLIAQIGHDNVRIVISKVRTEATQRWDELVAAEKQKDKKVILLHVHSLGSIFRSVGLMPAGDALRAIETQLRAGEEVPRGWMDALKTLKNRSIIALAAQIKETLTPS
ncbi:MAG: signal transduction histidine kinase/DNA-binding NarL/FixJ family response regulator [Planctomycetaceae bacterium]|jgi:signal transduction histidine kinase/DNA-binding NarL/FixJ family response regulator